MLADLVPAGWGDWWWGVAGGVVSSLPWAVLLVVIAVIALSERGGDLGKLLKGVLGATP